MLQKKGTPIINFKIRKRIGRSNLTVLDRIFEEE